MSIVSQEVFQDSFSSVVVVVSLFGTANEIDLALQVFTLSFETFFASTIGLPSRLLLVVLLPLSRPVALVVGVCCIHLA